MVSLSSVAAGQRFVPGMREYAQRDSSLWNPIVGAIAIGLVRQTACHCFGLYLLVLKGTGGGMVSAPILKKAVAPARYSPG